MIGIKTHLSELTDAKHKKPFIKRFLTLFVSPKKTLNNKQKQIESYVLSEQIRPFNEQIDEHLNESDPIDNLDEMLSYSNNHSSIEFTNINVLPVEIICQIFSFLEVSERKNASLVCKKWRFAFLNTHFLNDVLIKANNCLFISRPSSSTVIQKSNNRINSSHRAQIALSSYSSSATVSQFHYCLYKNAVNLEFENDSADVAMLIKNLSNLNHSQQGFNQSLFPSLKNLKFFKTTMSSKSLMELLKESPNLTSLHLVHCDSLLMTGFLSFTATNDLKLRHLNELVLSKNRYLTDSLLNMFINFTMELKSLDISYCCLTKSKFKSLSNSEFNSTTQNSNVVLTLENLKNIFNKSNKLISVNFSGIDLFNHDEDALVDLIDKLPELECLKLSQLPNLKVDTVNKLLRKCTKLKQIDLENSIQIDDLNQKSIESILETVVSQADLKSKFRIINLKKARVNNPQMLMEQICFFDNLVHLDMSCAIFQRSFSSSTRLNQYIDSFATNLTKCDKLEILELSYCDFLVNDSFIKIITKKLIKLKRLDLRNCGNITDVALHFITYFLVNLTHLDISWCQNVSDNGLDFNIEYEDSKKLLNEFNKHLNGACRCMRKYTEQPFLLMKTKAQIALNEKKQFCKCNGNENENEGLNQEKVELDFNILKQLDASLINDNFSLKSLKNLKVLKLEACVNITDEGLLNGINLIQLQELDIKLCTNITGDFVKSDAVNKFNNMKILNFNQCIQFKEENLINIVKRSPNLKELSVSAVSSVSNNLVEILLKEKRPLSLLDVSFCPSCGENEIDRYEQFLFNEFGSREFNLDKRFISKKQ